MINYLIVSIISGIGFGILDGLINGNPLATRLYTAFKPIAKTSLNLAAGIIIDLVYGFVLAALFLLLYQSLPGQSGFLKGISFGLIVWFLRVAMGVASQWLMFKVPIKTLLYTLVAGLAEMLILGVFYGLALQPASQV